MASFHDNMGQVVLKCQTILNYSAARDDGAPVNSTSHSVSYRPALPVTQPTALKIDGKL